MSSSVIKYVHRCQGGMHTSGLGGLASTFWAGDAPQVKCAICGCEMTLLAAYKAEATTETKEDGKR